MWKCKGVPSLDQDILIWCKLSQLMTRKGFERWCPGYLHSKRILKIKFKRTTTSEYFFLCLPLQFITFTTLDFYSSIPQFKYNLQVLHIFQLTCDEETREYLEYTESCSKTFHGGVHNCKKMPRTARAYADPENPTTFPVAIYRQHVTRWLVHTFFIHFSFFFVKIFVFPTFFRCSIPFFSPTENLSKTFYLHSVAYFKTNLKV